MLGFLKGAGRESPQRLPLFPLRTVLFPGGVLPLKVFEARYIDMTKACLAEDRPFGVCEAPHFAPIGTLARITNFDMPQLGILHLATLGLDRFQVQSHRLEANGLVQATVAPIAPEPHVALPPDYEGLARLLELIASRIGPENFPAEHAYDDASWVGYRLAELLPLPLHIKQSMLEINDAGVRLQVLRQFLQQQGVI
jgi:Lon protease-like protein